MTLPLARTVLTFLKPMAWKADVRAAIVTRLLPTLLTPLRKATVAEGEGFEPPFRRTGKRFSRPPPSTTRPSLRATATFYVLRARLASVRRPIETRGSADLRPGRSAPGHSYKVARPRG